MGSRKRSDDPPIQFPTVRVDPTAELLADPLLDPVARLKDILRQTERAHDEWLAAEAKCDDLIEGSDQLDRARQEVRAAYKRWKDYSDQAREVEAEVRRRSLEIPREGKVKQEYDSLVKVLQGQYDGLGPHYDLLCENTAALTIRLRLMETSGRDVSSGEYKEMHDLYLRYVNQLQKYTEAMKSESINRLTQEVAEQIVQIFERHFGNTYPEEWQSAVKELRVLVEEAA